MIGEKNLVEDFTRNPRSPLICTKVKPTVYHTIKTIDLNFSSPNLIILRILSLF